MGQCEYAMVKLPLSPYEDEARELLGSLFDAGVNMAGCTGQELTHAFVASGLAHQFEQMNPVYVAGKSSYDLLYIMEPLLSCDTLPEPRSRLNRTPDWWLGWMLAHFQQSTGCSYRAIFERASYEEMRAMYWPLHEAPDNKFVEVLSQLLEERRSATRLRWHREAAGLSQSQLAEQSGVGLRSIQMYEQRQKDINKAQAISLFALAQALHCSMDSLLER